MGWMLPSPKHATFPLRPAESGRDVGSYYHFSWHLDPTDEIDLSSFKSSGRRHTRQNEEIREFTRTRNFVKNLADLFQPLWNAQITDLK